MTQERAAVEIGNGTSRVPSCVCTAAVGSGAGATTIRSCDKHDELQQWIIYSQYVDIAVSGYYEMVLWMICNSRGT